MTDRPDPPLTLCACLALALLIAGCTTSHGPHQSHCGIDRSAIHEQLTGTLWVRTSAEYGLGTRQTYRAATEALDAALADPTRTAALEQTPPYSDKPPAVILDIDETVLDNSSFEAQKVLDGVTFSSAAWVAWVNRASAGWVPGARAFLDHARHRGVTVFLITNRAAEREPRTRQNLERLGLTLPATPDTILSRNEREGWTSDKTSRRAYVARDYRVLVMLGDDLNDFVPARSSPDVRRDTGQTHAQRFGESWFLLPNPLYGSWERALWDSPDDCRAMAQRREHLRGHD